MRALYWLFAAGLVVSIGSGCQKEKAKDAESPTSGNLTFACAESATPVLEKEAAEFVRLYAKAAISLDSTTTRAALIQFLNGTTKMVVVSRDLNAEEKNSFAAGKIEYNSFVLAKYGIAVVVHPDNPVKQLTLDEVRGIYAGKISRWEEVGGTRGDILPLAMSKNSGVAESFFQTVGIDTGFSAALRVVPASREMVGTISRNPSAIGFVSMNWVSSAVKALALAKEPSEEYVTLHQASVYNGAYPLVESLHAYTTAGAYGLASGFIAFLVSAPGQKIFLDSGLVPATMPVKLIRID